MKSIFDQSSIGCSELITKNYSTSFSLGIRLLAPSIRPAIYSIYGFVRLADEIVDTFHDYDQTHLLHKFIEDYKAALDQRISLNPVLNAFQKIVHEYQLYDLVDSFLESMLLDLEKDTYDTKEGYEQYIYGSADVVGLMCLKVLVGNDQEMYDQLTAPAMSLGSAFQKVNFLRDFKDDIEVLGRSYFPSINGNRLDEQTKREIINEIEEDFRKAYQGIIRLPSEGRLGVYVAYRYYKKLLGKLQRMESQIIMTERVRISDIRKVWILCKSFLRYKLNLLNL